MRVGVIASWPCPAPHDGCAPEYAVALDRGRSFRLLVIPALFDEANRLRRFTVELLRELDKLEVDGFLPDLPGSNESLRPLDAQTLTGWRDAMAAAARHFGATHVLAIRGGSLIAPNLPGWNYAALTGATILRQMIRVRILSAREAGREESQAALLEAGLHDGLVLSGYRLAAPMIAELQQAQPTALTPISQADIGGAGLWLRAEPGDDPAQSRALARIVGEARA